MERTIRRADLRSDSSSPSYSPEPEAVDRLRQLERFEFSKTNISAEKSRSEEDPPGSDEEFDFRLFAASSQAEQSQPVMREQKIRIRSPSIDYTTAGFINPKRDSNYYFASTPSATQKENFEAAAMSGQQVLARSHSQWPGTMYSWRFLRIPASEKRSSMRSNDLIAFKKLVDEGIPRKRKRPGKKYRIKLRIKHASMHAKQKSKEAQEAAEREKRTRRNREKKVKKRLRDKAKKCEANAQESSHPLGQADHSDASIG